MRTAIGCLGLVVFWFALHPSTPLPAAESGTLAEQAGPAQSGAKTLEELVHDLRSEKSQVRVAAADALGAMRAEAKAAVPNLIGALSDENFWAASAITDALSTIGAPAVPAVVDVLREWSGYGAGPCDNGPAWNGTSREGGGARTLQGSPDQDTANPRLGRPDSSRNWKAAGRGGSSGRRPQRG